MKLIYLVVVALSLTACVKREAKKEQLENHVKHPCTREYRPVCAEVEIQCVTTPCEPIKKSFSNRCEMRNNPHATFLHKGSCRE